MEKSGLFGLLAFVAPFVVGCSSEEPTNDGSLRGTLMVYLATLDDGTSRNDYRLFVAGDERDARPLIFENPPDLGSGSGIRVWARPSGRSFVVDRYEPDVDAARDLETSEQAIIDGTPYATRRFAYVLVDIGGGRGSYTEAQARIDAFGTADGNGSLKQWFLEGSFGRQDITGDVVAGLSFPMTGCDYTALTSELRPRVNEILGSAAQGYLWQFLTRNPSCGWSGVASVGAARSPRADTWFNAATGCAVLAQEPLHNFGMQHSSLLRCSGTPLANNPSSCTHSEYGDPYDPLGSGCRHTNAWQKAYMGWFGGCNRVRVNQSGTFTLHPLEVECNGIQVLQIPMPVTTRTIRRTGGGSDPSTDPIQFYYLELRTRTGFDEPMSNAPVVLVHVAPEFGESIITGKHTWILDMNPSTNDVDGLPAGQTYTDPAGGVSFTVDAVNANSATVRVTVPTSDANTCIDGGVLPSPGGATTCNGGVGAGGGAGADGMGGRAAAGSGGGGRSGGGAGGRAGASAAGASGAGAGGGGAGIAGSDPGNAGGVAGTAGTPSGGSNVTGGFSGASTSAGAPAVGGSSAGQSFSPDEDTDEGAGCGCRIAGQSTRPEPGRAIGLLGIAVLAFARRRKRPATA